MLGNTLLKDRKQRKHLSRTRVKESEMKMARRKASLNEIPFLSLKEVKLGREVHLSSHFESLRSL